ncbi:MAG TPA: hypothetical protein VKB38_15385 [Terracidiphilus sp.]|nr:hypothetical protein [Terracidiphilus sp.]
MTNLHLGASMRRIALCIRLFVPLAMMELAVLLLTAATVWAGPTPVSAAPGTYTVTLSPR